VQCLPRWALQNVQSKFRCSFLENCQWFVAYSVFWLFVLILLFSLWFWFSNLTIFLRSTIWGERLWHRLRRTDLYSRTKIGSLARTTPTCPDTPSTWICLRERGSTLPRLKKWSGRRLMKELICLRTNQPPAICQFQKKARSSRESRLSRNSSSMWERNWIRQTPRFTWLSKFLISLSCISTKLETWMTNCARTKAWGSLQLSVCFWRQSSSKSEEFTQLRLFTKSRDGHKTSLKSWSQARSRSTSWKFLTSTAYF